MAGLDANNLLLYGVLGLGAYLFYQQFSKLPKPEPAPKPVPPLTEDEAALIVIANQPGLCATMSSMSGGFFNCNTEAEKIKLVKEWFYHTDPTKEATYHNLVAYVQQKGWKSNGPPPPPPPATNECPFVADYRYVVQDTDGMYMIVWNGKFGGKFSDRQSAEQRYDELCAQLGPNGSI